MAPTTTEPAGGAASAPAPVAASARPFVAFGVGGVGFAVPLSEVVEVLRPPELVPIPLGPPSLEGLARRRGAVLPVISLRRILGLSGAEGDAGPEGGTGPEAKAARVVVVRHNGQPVGLVADRMGGIATVAGDRIVGVEEAGSDAPVERGLLAGVIRAPEGEESRLILDTGPVIERQFQDLGRTVPAAGFGGGDGRVAASPAQAPADEVRLVAFEVAGQGFALPVGHVREIVPLPAAVTRVPRARAHLLGVMTLRDALLPLVDLRALFRLEAPGVAGRRVVVVRTGEGEVGAVVDGVREILSVPRGLVDPVPPLLAREAEFEDVAGIARLDGGRRLVSVLSAERLFRHGAALGRDGRSDAQGKGDEPMTEGVALEPALERDGRSEPFVVFRLAGAEYGLPVAAVQEVLRRPEAPTPLPNAPDFVAGVVTVRGTVLPVIDQRRLLRLPAGGEAGGDRGRVVVIAAGAARAGLLVDGMTGIVRVPERRIEDAPLVSQAQRRLIRRVAALEDGGGRRMILLMDPGELLDMDRLASLLPG